LCFYVILQKFVSLQVQMTDDSTVLGLSICQAIQDFGLRDVHVRKLLKIKSVQEVYHV